MSHAAALARAPRDVAAEEGALRARLAFVRRLAGQLRDGGSVAAQALAAYDDILDEIIHDVAVEAHRRARTGQPAPATTDEAAPRAPAVAATAIPAAAPAAAAVHASRASHAAVDAFGAPLRPPGGGGAAGGDVECTQCGRRVAAPRFAPHLEKCLGGGRAAGRAASRRYAE